MFRLVMRSNLPDAEKFQAWVYEEVLPQIRKTGSYSEQPALPDFSDPAAAARAWADEYEAKKVALEANVQLATQNNELRTMIGCATEWKQVIAIEFLYDYFDMKDKTTLQQLGRSMASISRALGKEIKHAPHSTYPNGVGVYHISVVEAFKARLMNDPSFLDRYRVTT